MNILLWIALPIIAIAALPHALMFLAEMWHIFLEEIWDPFWDN